MTNYVTQTQTCCLCDTACQCELVESTESEGSPDLDLRPAPPERDSMHAWFQQCSNCHYVSVDLSRDIENAKQIVASPSYLAIANDSEISPTARKFALCATLNEQDREIFATAMLRAAWACDDDQNSARATSFRSEAADSLKQLQPFEDSPEQATTAVTLIDILRRSARFEEATKLANQLLKFKTVKRSEVMLAVVKFQLALCESQSVDCHQVEQAMTQT